MSTQPVKTYFPKTRLSELVKRIGGLARDEAVARAEENIEPMRSDADAAIRDAMTAIESAIGRAQHKELAASDMREVLRQSDLIVTLAGMRGYASLRRVMQSMCDITYELLRDGLSDAAPIVVHAQSMRLTAPGGPALSEAETEYMLSELARLLRKYNCVPIGENESNMDDLRVADASAPGGPLTEARVGPGCAHETYSQVGSLFVQGEDFGDGADEATGQLA